ncbi:MAG: IS1182 family transposase [Cyanobacteria bacterium]|jgi:hypothetical protein|nr:IS1182 family transposase [Cyanobacteria bacterium GSL.Bin21]
MRPPNWNPPIDLSPAEQRVIQKIRKGKLFVFLRLFRHQIFNEEFQAKLAEIFKDSTVGKCPVSPALLALTIILQAYTGVSDDEVIEALVMDRRWQLVLDCMDCEVPPFSKTTLVRFRAALIAKNVDRDLLEQTVKIAQKNQGFSASSLRRALDSSPLWGAARVEDTYNLLGHALRKALTLLVEEYGEIIEEITPQLGADLISGTSLKAALDLDWDDPEARILALSQILETLEQVEQWTQTNSQNRETDYLDVKKNLDTAIKIKEQDIEESKDGSPKLRKGVAKDRRIAIEDDQMRHGRKSRSKRFDGYKRHVLKDIDLGVVRAVGLTPANAAEASVTPKLEEDLLTQNVTFSELHIDRGYLNCHWVKERSSDLNIFCKAWRVKNGNRFDKTAFVLNWEQQKITCPNEVTLNFEPGRSVRFPKEKCQECPLNFQCTTSKNGRSVSIHPDEALLSELREKQLTSQGRKRLRERVTVEHSLAHISQWQGEKARYLGLRKNLFDLRRMAIVHNLHVVMRSDFWKGQLQISSTRDVPSTQTRFFVNPFY